MSTFIRAFAGPLFLTLAVSTATALPPVAITEWMYQGSSSGGGEYVEFTNVSGEAVDMTGWSFDDDARVPGAFSLSAFGVVQPGESVIITEETVTAFRSAWGLAPSVKVIGGLGAQSGNNLGRNDEINLYDAGGNLVDRLTYGDQAFPGSIRTRWFGGNPTSIDALGANDVYKWILAAPGDAAGSWVSSFGDVGNPGTFPLASGPSSAPEFSVTGGFHTAPFELTLSAEPGATIRYTLDGSTPTATSPAYTTPLAIAPIVGQPNYFSMIQSSPPEGWNTPLGSVFKATVIRAAAFKPGAEPSPVRTETFFVDPSIHTRWSLPVFALAADEAALFGYEPGIYVPGKIYDDNFDPSVEWFKRDANYRERGIEWERLASLEFYERDGANEATGGIPTLNHAIGVRTHGGVIRAFRRKPLRLYARSEYGPPTFDHQFFPDVDQPDFKRLVLRNGGDDWNRTLMRDVLMQSLVADCGIDTQAARFAILFVNGEYWGIHDLRERYDHHYILANHGWSQGQIDLITDFDEVIEGNVDHWLETYFLAVGTDLADPENLAAVEARVDLDDHITHFAAQIYFGNTDWPQNNFDQWRPRTPTGRWRWLMYDTDRGFGAEGASEPWNFNMLVWLGLNISPHATFFANLLESESYRHRFINRSADLLNTAFMPTNVIARIDELQGTLAPNIVEHIARWREPTNLGQFNTRVNGLRDFATNRPPALRGHIQNRFDLLGQSTLTFDNPTPERGSIRINTVDLADGAHGPLPWTGVYFDTVPVPIHATPAPGFRFAGFAELPPTTDNPLLYIPTGNATLTARFVALADLNADGVVDGADLGLLLNTWGTCPTNGTPCPADLNADDVVDGADLGLLLNSWGD